MVSVFRSGGLTARIVLLSASVIISVVVLECCIRIYGTILTLAHTSVERQKNEIVILTVGESTTASLLPDSWPKQLETVIHQRFPSIKLDIVNTAKIGAHTGMLTGNLERQIQAYKPDVIVVMMGINDRLFTEFRDDGFGYAYTVRSYRFRVQKLSALIAGVVRLRLVRYADFFLHADQEFLNKKSAYFRVTGRYGEAEAYSLYSIRLDPSHPDSRLELYRLYDESGRISEAERLIRTVTEMYPNVGDYVVEQGEFYSRLHKYDEAENSFMSALIIDPCNGRAYTDLGLLYLWYRKDSVSAEGFYKKAIVCDPGKPRAYLELAGIYTRAGDSDTAKDLYNRVLETDPQNTEAQLGIRSLSMPVSKDSSYNDVGYESQDILTAFSRQQYVRFVETARKYGIPVIAMQYPMISADPLRELLSGFLNGPPTVSIVSNEENFRSAIATMPYDSLFIDTFGGVFRHATKYGNQMIADRVADELERLGFVHETYESDRSAQ